MNRSGQAVSAVCAYYKILPHEVLIVHDELDLPRGKMRIKMGGGNAGHNGLRSITALCGNDYRRVRLGIGHPGDKALVHHFVLSDFDRDEREWVEALCRAVADNAVLLADKQDSEFQNRIHRAMDGVPGQD